MVKDCKATGLEYSAGCSLAINKVEKCMHYTGRTAFFAWMVECLICILNLINNTTIPTGCSKQKNIILKSTKMTKIHAYDSNV